jgi:Bacillus/Clostridium GerA spore germination protein
VSTPNWIERGLEEMYGERLLKGPKVGFTEKIKTNINILRSILKTPEFIVEEMSYGKYAETDISIVYLKISCRSYRFTASKSSNIKLGCKFYIGITSC